MSNFTDILRFENTNRFHPSGRRIWRTSRALVYRVGAEFSPLALVVPQGFETDLTSVPRILWPIVPPDNSAVAAAVLHDYLYQTGIISRWMADIIFFEALGVLEVPFWRRWIRYGTVRIFGWIFYNQGAK